MADDLATSSGRSLSFAAPKSRLEANEPIAEAAGLRHPHGLFSYLVLLASPSSLLALPPAALAPLHLISSALQRPPHRPPLASRSSRSSSMAPHPVHLCVVLHGLWGNPSHIGYVCRSLAAKAGANSPKSRQRSSSPTRIIQDVTPTLVVLPAKLNAETRTYDGIDLCAERVVQEIDEGESCSLSDSDHVSR